MAQDRDGAAEMAVPLILRISLNAAAATAPPQATMRAAFAPEAAAVKLRIPVIYDALEERRGFDPLFLDLPDDMPAPAPALTPVGEAVAAPLLESEGHELRYQHFSVWMHKARRLALFTASNVDFRDRRKVVDGRSTSRDSLNGFPPGGAFAEQWVTDGRIAPEHQLPDIFYTEDRGAFDKGHIVRRDDVCWGNTFEDIQMANGDTFHVTNCSPQVKGFNQSAAGEDNWGDLEEYIQKTTIAERETAIVYAGPVLGAADPWFRGRDDAGAVLRVQVPDRFWKIVVARGEDGPEAYGFVLEQNVDAVTEKGFVVTPRWQAKMMPIAGIEDLLRGWISLAALVPFDRFDAGADRAALVPAATLAQRRAPFPNESAAYGEARAALLAGEIELRRHIERIAAQRRALPPGPPVSQDYAFIGEDGGSVPLSALFGGGDTLLAYIWMSGRDSERPCPMCTSLLDALDGNAADIAQRVPLVVIGGAAIARQAAFKAERGWRHLRLYESPGDDFLRAYRGLGPDGREEWPAMLVFRRDADGTIRLFWAAEIGGDMADPGQDPRGAPDPMPLWNMLDLTPAGRGTDWYPKLAYD